MTAISPKRQDFSNALHRVSETIRISQSALGISSLGFHQCRHTYAFQWLRSGGSLAALQLVLGHADIKTTMIYAKATDALVRREAERIWADEARTAAS